MARGSLSGVARLDRVGARAENFPPNVTLGPSIVILGPSIVILGPSIVILGLDPRIGQPRHLVRLLNSSARREILGSSPRMTGRGGHLQWLIGMLIRLDRAIALNVVLAPLARSPHAITHRGPVPPMTQAVLFVMARLDRAIALNGVLATLARSGRAVMSMRPYVAVQPTTVHCRP